VIWYWPYALKPKRRLSALAGDAPRRGALIRVDEGFADVHPWPELGDATIDEQLALLARGETTALTKRSLWFASEWRPRMFDGLTIPRSHWPGSDPPDEFDTAKVKMPGGVLPDRVRLRLDFNGDGEAFERVVSTLPSERIDFIEDPCPYDPATWTRMRAETRLRFALDRGDAEEGVDVLVVKPAVQNVPRTAKEIVITSYMDHPIGQLHAAYVAAGCRPHTAGLITHVLYEKDPFIERMRIDDTRLAVPDFSDLLESLPWKKLA
jgi:O-succinylbenzoate synthase